jgi:aspartate aminotransferase-like enzyme
VTTVENERLAKLEQRVEHMEGQVHGMAVQVSEMHSVLMQAKGARWLIVTSVGIGGILTSIGTYLTAHWRP